jgi:hypothetical protein
MDRSIRLGSPGWSRTKTNMTSSLQQYMKQQELFAHSGSFTVNLRYELLRIDMRLDSRVNRNTKC